MKTAARRVDKPQRAKQIGPLLVSAALRPGKATALNAQNLILLGIFLTLLFGAAEMRRTLSDAFALAAPVMAAAATAMAALLAAVISVKFCFLWPRSRALVDAAKADASNGSRLLSALGSLAFGATLAAIGWYFLIPSPSSFASGAIGIATALWGTFSFSTGLWGVCFAAAKTAVSSEETARAKSELKQEGEEKIETLRRESREIDERWALIPMAAVPFLLLWAAMGESVTVAKLFQLFFAAASAFAILSGLIWLRLREGNSHAVRLKAELAELEKKAAADEELARASRFSVGGWD